MEVSAPHLALSSSNGQQGHLFDVLGSFLQANWLHDANEKTFGKSGMLGHEEYGEQETEQPASPAREVAIVSNKLQEAPKLLKRIV